MNNLETIQLRIKEMLKNFGQTKMNVHFTLFPNKKIGMRERKKLRHALINQIKNHKDFKKHEKDFDWNSLLRIGQKPECPFASISISHCHFLGAFLFIFDKNISIGFDMEQKKRITKKIIERISSTKEIQQSPSPSLLWGAKEASFKCLSNSQTQLLLSDCLISHWKKDPEKQMHFFSCHSKKNNKKAVGMACVIGDLVIAYAEIKIREA